MFDDARLLVLLNIDIRPGVSWAFFVCTNWYLNRFNDSRIMHEMRSRVAEILEITRSYSVLSSTYIESLVYSYRYNRVIYMNYKVLIDIPKLIYVLYKYNLV